MASAKQLRPVPWKIGDALLLLGAYWVVIPFVIVLLAVAGSHLWRPVADVVALWQKQDTVVNFSLNAVVDLAAAGVLWAIVKRRGGHWKDLGWRKFNVGQAVLFVAGLFVVFIVAVVGLTWVVEHYLPLYNVNQPQTNEFTGKGVIDTGWALVALVLMPPIIEETIFRGFMLPAFAQKMGFWGGAVVSRLIFGFVHGQVNVGVYTFILGMFFCYLYRKFDSIVPGMMLHMLNNLISYWSTASR